MSIFPVYQESSLTTIRRKFIYLSFGAHTAPLPLARIQLDNQLLVDHRLDLFPRRNAGYFAFESIAIDRQPIGHWNDLGQLEIAQGQLSRLRFVFHRNFIASFHVVGRNIDCPAVYQDVPMGNELARAAAGIGQAQTEDDVVETGLE